MRKPSRLALLAGLAATGLAAGLANAASSTSASSDDPVGGYFGFGITRPHIDNIYDDDLNIRKNEWKILGGISQRWLAFEADYYNLGSVSSANGNAAATAIAGYAVISAPVSKVTLLGKIGGTRWQMRGDAGGGSFDDNGWGMAWGVGAQFKYSSYTLRFEYERLSIANTDGGVVYGLSVMFNL
ncbi:MAG: outer membrane beta-barrel protein [Pseudomonadota bacterium]|nr:outer membrane beta-barrel protein [Pseudomonadota bacterium]